MKRIFAVLISAIVLLTSGCNFSVQDLITKINNESKNDTKTKGAHTVMFENIIAALDNDDSETLKALFAPNALNKLPKSTNKLKSLWFYIKGGLYQMLISAQVVVVDILNTEKFFMNP